MYEGTPQSAERRLMSEVGWMMCIRWMMFYVITYYTPL